MAIYFMKKLLLISFASLILAGCANHTPAPKPTGSLFKINEQPLVQPTIQPIQLEVNNG